MTVPTIDVSDDDQPFIPDVKELSSSGRYFLENLWRQTDRATASKVTADHIKSTVEDSGRLYMAELVGYIRLTLGFPIPNVETTRLILDAIKETERLAGYPDPDLIFIRLEIKREALLQTR